MRRPWIWLFPLAIAGTAFWLSSRSVLPLGVHLVHPQDWAAHAAEYALLGFSLDVAARWTWPGLPLYRRHLFLFLALVLFGVSDEFHQSFVPGRDADGFDVLADALGAALGLALTCLPALKSRRLACLSWRRGRLQRPDPSALLILVADPHWSLDLTGLREAQAAHPEADWLFLGDVFDIWVGVPGMDSPLQREFLAWVGERRQAGRWVGFWMGNREYFLDGLSPRFDLMGEGVGGALPGEGLAWEHGDLVNPADWRYRVWNLLSHSGPMWLFTRLLPRPLTRALAQWLHRTLHTTNQAYKLTFPREAFRAAAAERLPSVFITGHFHTHERAGNGIALPWAHDGKFMAWQDGEIRRLSE